MEDGAGLRAGGEVEGRSGRIRRCLDVWMVIWVAIESEAAASHTGRSSGETGEEQERGGDAPAFRRFGNGDSALLDLKQGSFDGVVELGTATTEEFEKATHPREVVIVYPLRGNSLEGGEDVVFPEGGDAIDGALAFGSGLGAGVNGAVGIEAGESAVRKLPTRAAEAMAVIDQVSAETGRGRGALTDKDGLPRIGLIDPSIEGEGEKQVGQVGDFVEETPRQKVEDGMAGRIDGEAGTEVDAGGYGDFAIAEIKFEQVISGDGRLNAEELDLRGRDAQMLEKVGDDPFVDEGSCSLGIADALSNVGVAGGIAHEKGLRTPAHALLNELYGEDS